MSNKKRKRFLPRFKTTADKQLETDNTPAKYRKIEKEIMSANYTDQKKGTLEYQKEQNQKRKHQKIAQRNKLYIGDDGYRRLAPFKMSYR